LEIRVVNLSVAIASHAENNSAGGLTRDLPKAHEQAVSWTSPATTIPRNARRLRADRIRIRGLGGLLRFGHGQIIRSHRGAALGGLRASPGFHRLRICMVGGLGLLLMRSLLFICGEDTVIAAPVDLENELNLSRRRREPEFEPECRGGKLAQKFEANPTIEDLLAVLSRTKTANEVPISWLVNETLVLKATRGAARHPIYEVVG
jgi:hypothetical protein